jgi:hypothetical protein
LAIVANPKKAFDMITKTYLKGLEKPPSPEQVKIRPVWSTIYIWDRSNKFRFCRSLGHFFNLLDGFSIYLVGASHKIILFFDIAYGFPIIVMERVGSLKKLPYVAFF